MKSNTERDETPFHSLIFDGEYKSIHLETNDKVNVSDKNLHIGSFYNKKQQQFLILLFV